jgi:YfiH family protein
VATPSASQSSTSLPAPFDWQGQQIGVELRGGRALFTTRRGGSSRPPYATLNLGALVPGPGDEARRVAANRAAIAELVGLTPAAFAYGRQVHGSDVARVRERAPSDWGSGRPAAVSVPAADGQASALHDLALVVLSADCLPVALIAPGAVAIVHAGWRGLAAGVLSAGVAAVRELAGDVAISAAIGPGARRCCYEVGEEVHRALTTQPGQRDGRRIDLAAIATQQLRAAAVSDIHDVGLCTICRPELFFSHRRDGGVTGRQGAVAWRS